MIQYAKMPKARKKRETLLMITWRDIRSPFAGGAEQLTHGILKRLTQDYDVTVLSSAFPNCRLKETIDKVKYIRLGHKKNNYIGVYNWRIYFSVIRYWWKFIRGKQRFDVVIEQINNIPFLYALYADKRTIIYINQLCRQNWFYQVPKILALVGYFIFEPLYLWLLRNRKVITISQSTKNDLLEYGFKNQNIGIIRKGIVLKPVSSPRTIKKYKRWTLLSLGAIRGMKQTHQQLLAFELAKKDIPELKLKIAGSVSHDYGMTVLKMLEVSKYRRDMEYMGSVRRGEKRRLMQCAHLVLMTSVKEGWGLVVTEAASQGTPAVVYSTSGLKDSVVHRRTGLICRKNTPETMAKNIVKLYKDKKLYRKLQKEAWQWSQEMTYENVYRDFRKLLSRYTQ